MKIHKLSPAAFGKFHNRSFQFEEGLNVITAENEAGKSTLMAFLKGMLYGIEKSRGRAAKLDPYVKFLPLDQPGAYQGSMVMSVGGKAYELHRSFLQTKKSLSVVDPATGRSLALGEHPMEKLLPGFSETSFSNTVYVHQGSAVMESGLAGEFQNYLTNLSLAKEQEVDVGGALEYLNGCRKEIEREAFAKREEELNRQITECEYRLEALEQVAAEREQLQERLTHLAAQSHTDAVGDAAREREFAVMEERFYQYRRDLLELEEYRRALQRSLSDASDDCEEALGDVRKRITQLETLRQKETEYSVQSVVLSKEWQETDDRIQRKSRLLRFGALGLGGVLVLLSCILLLAVSFGVGLVCLFGGLALVGYGVWLTVQTTKELEKAQAEHNRAVFMLNQERAYHEQQLAAGGSMEALQSELQELLQKQAAREQRLSHTSAQLAALTEKETQLAAFYEELSAYFTEQGLVGALTDSSISELRGRQLAALIAVQKSKEQLDAERQSLSKRLAGLESELERGARIEDRLMELREELGRLLEARKEADFQLEAIALAQKVITTLSEEIHDSFGKELNRKASQYAARFTDGAYDSIFLDEKLQVGILKQERRLNPSQLSKGTLEQLCLAVRLAVADTMCPEESLPLVFDDAFAFYDDTRLAKTLETLAACGHQVLLFTCSHREEQLLQSLGIAYHAVCVE